MNSPVWVQAVPSIADIGETTWNSLARDGGFYLGYPWLTWAEADPSVTASYLVARDADGTAMGAVVTYLWDGCAVPSMNLAYSPGHIAEENLGRKLSDDEHRSFLPAMLVGSRAGYHGGVVLRAGLAAAERAELLTALFSAVDTAATRSGAASVAMLYVPVAHAAECRAAWSQAAGDRIPGVLFAPLSAEAVITWEDAQSDPARGHGKWRREQRRFMAAADRVEILRLSQCVDRIAPLLGITQRKYGCPDTDEDMRRYLEQQIPALDAYSHVLLEFQGSVPVGFSLNYLWHDGVYVRAVGFDPRAARYSYFNLAVYRPQDIAVSNGLAMVNLGAGTYAAKRSRGALPRYSAGLVRPPAGTSPEVVRALRAAGLDYQDARRTWPPEPPGDDRSDMTEG